jgi:hypothetical protein
MSISNEFGINPSKLRLGGSNKFTYIIRSPTTGLNNNIYLRLNGLPSQYKYFDCKVHGFFTKFKFQDVNQNGFLCELKCYGASIVNGRDGNQNLNTVAFTTTNNDYVNEPYAFRIGNFNNQLLNFQMVNETGALFANSNYTDQPWVLVLNMEGVDDETI